MESSEPVGGHRVSWEEETSAHGSGCPDSGSVSSQLLDLKHLIYQVMIVLKANILMSPSDVPHICPFPILVATYRLSV